MLQFYFIDYILNGRKKDDNFSHINPKDYETELKSKHEQFPFSRIDPIPEEIDLTTDSKEPISKKQLIKDIYVDKKLANSILGRNKDTIFESNIDPYGININGIIYNRKTYAFENVDCLKLHLCWYSIIILWKPLKENTPAERLLTKWDHILYDIKYRYILQIYEPEKSSNIEKMKELDKRSEKYYELLYAVESKFPNESRHDTALRYIQEAERRKYEGSCKQNIK